MPPKEDFSFEFTPSKEELDLWVEHNPDLIKHRVEMEGFLAELQAMPDEERARYQPLENIRANLRNKLLENFERPQLTKAEIQENFTSEHLSSLNLEEYLALLLRVPARFLVHISRHGFKDRSSHHSLSGNDFSHGFEAMLRAGEIQSVNDQISKGAWTADSVAEKMESISPRDKTKQAQAHRVDQLLNIPENPYIVSEFADGTAVHAAIDYAADWYYGGETGNQVFMIYPAAMIASEYNLTSQNHKVPDKFNVKKERLDDDKNDIWMIRKDNRRGTLPLEAGILFLPANAKVDPETGSCYQSDESGIRTEDRPLAFETISSQEYWEAYFTKTGYRPSKVIFYDEEDPNEALATFREKTGLHFDLHRDQSLTEMFSENMHSQHEFKDLLSGKAKQFESIATEVLANTSITQ
ncbi:MAG: hypothetical protein ACI9QC_000563 [Oceanicoccus sp.]|jgi:hypothetical protein